MKKLLSIFLFATFLCTFNACKDEDEIYYEGESLLHFDKTAQTANVILNTNNADYLLTYGVTKPSEADSNVELVFNSAKSTAVLGTDFTIIEGTDVLSKGTSIGNFKLNVKETAAKAGKKAYFTVRSSGLSAAAFNQEVEVSFVLVCPPDTFAGLFQTKTALFGSPYTIEIELGAEPNTLVLKDYIEVGTDIIVNYDPTNGIVTFPAQATGYLNGSTMVFIKQAVDGSVSRVDFCNKKLELRVSYGPAGGTYTIGGNANHTEISTGI